MEQVLMSPPLKRMIYVKQWMLSLWGTGLKIPAMKKFAAELCHSAKWGNGDGMTLWVNKERPKLGSEFDSLLDYVILGDCDEFTSLVSA